VLDEADFSGSTSAMIKWVTDNQPDRVLMVTECSMSDNVAVENPHSSRGRSQLAGRSRATDDASNHGRKRVGTCFDQGHLRALGRIGKAAAWTMYGGIQSDPVSLLPGTETGGRIPFCHQFPVDPH
ncbi:MAG: hypothetical protein ABF313_15870, partial [Marivita sp.]